ncbi:MAG: RNA polymerase sigma factor [Planctomycetota bacterium]
MTDRTALQLYAAHADADAFRQLVHTYQGLVLSTCRRILRVREDAEDATQRTFLRLAQQAGTIRGDLAAWLHRCAHNVSVDLIRRDATRRRHEQAAAEQAPLTGHAADHSDAVAWSEVSEHIDAAVAELDEPWRSAIVGYFLQGRSQRDLAAGAGVSAAAMNRRIVKATQTLRVALRRRGVTATAAALTAGLPAFAAEASAVPGALTAELVKVGLAGSSATAGVATGATDLGLGVKAGLAAVGVVALTAVVAPAVLRDSSPAAGGAPVAVAAVPTIHPAPQNVNRLQLPNGTSTEGVLSQPHAVAVPQAAPAERASFPEALRGEWKFGNPKHIEQTPVGIIAFTADTHVLMREDHQGRPVRMSFEFVEAIEEPGDAGRFKARVVEVQGGPPDYAELMQGRVVAMLYAIEGGLVRLASHDSSLEAMAEYPAKLVDEDGISISLLSREWPPAIE